MLLPFGFTRSGWSVSSRATAHAFAAKSSPDSITSRSAMPKPARSSAIHTRYDRRAHTFLSAIAFAASFIFWLNQSALTLDHDLKFFFVNNIRGSLPVRTISCSLQSPRRLILSRDTKEGAPLTGRAPFLCRRRPQTRCCILTATALRMRSVVKHSVGTHAIFSGDADIACRSSR